MTAPRLRAILLAALLGAGCEAAPPPATIPADCAPPVGDAGSLEVGSAAAADAQGAPPDAPGALEVAAEVAPASDAAPDDAPDAALDGTPDVTSGPPADAAEASCTDKIRNGDETDVDCGGSCAPCPPNKSCRLDADCSATASGCDAAHGGCRCDATSRRCVFNHCFDDKSDDGETGLDCGGDLCAVCGLGQTCRQDTDCSSQACDGVSLKCVANPCSDHRQDGRETDVDCGGVNSCVRCRPGLKCTGNSDCQGGHTCSTDGSQVCL
jgi:hypothetical protein